jgi:hypothetical protein
MHSEHIARGSLEMTTRHYTPNGSLEMTTRHYTLQWKFGYDY